MDEQLDDALDLWGRVLAIVDIDDMVNVRTLDLQNTARKTHLIALLQCLAEGFQQVYLFGVQQPALDLALATDHL